MKSTGTLARRWKPIVFAGFLLAVLALWPASQLRIVTQIAALLPSGSPASADYEIFLDRFGGTEKVLVAVVAGDDVEREAAAELVTDTADELVELLSVSPEVRFVRSGIAPDDELFLNDYVLPRALLLMDDDWEQVLERATTERALDRRVERIRSELMSPLGSFNVDYLSSDPLGLASGLPIVGPDSVELPIDPATLNYLSTDGRASLVVVTPAGSEIDAAAGRELARTLESAFETVRANAQADLRFAAIGGPLYAAHDEEIIRSDLEWTLSGAMVGCTVLLIVAFGSLVLPLASVVSVVVGLVGTMALLSYGLGSISSIGIGFGAVLVGLGLDYGIHGTVQYCQQRLGGLDTTTALDATFLRTGPGIVTSAITTAAAFAVLSMAHLRPIWELGLIVSIGILAILVSSATVGAASLVGADETLGLAMPSGVVWRFLERIVDGCARFGSRRATSVLVVAAAMTAAATWGLASLRVRPDLESMRPTHHPTVLAEQMLTRHFPIALDTITCVVSGPTVEQALDEAARVETVLQEELGDRGVITSPTAWLGIPRVIDSRLRALADSGLEPTLDRFERKLRDAGLRVEGFARGLDALRDMAHGKDPGIPPPPAWPDWLDEFVRMDADGAAVAVKVRLQPGVWPEGPPDALRDRLHADFPGVALASIANVGRDLRRIAGADLRRLGGVAALALVTVVLLSFRGDYRSALLALIPVALGTVWVVGLWSLMGHTLDLFGIAVLPIVLGIGIDDGLHAIHGARKEAAGSVVASVRSSGRAMLLTTLTTMLGFGSLAFSHLPGLRRGGALVSIGVLACLVATLIVLPALDRRLGRHR